MSTITQAAAAVTCTGFGERHTDSVVYHAAPSGRVRLDWRSTWEGEELVPSSLEVGHILHCTRHTPSEGSSSPVEFYVTAKQGRAGILLDGVPLLEHPSYLIAAARLAESLAHLPVLDCPDGVDSIQGVRGRIMVEGQLVFRGQYRLNYGDGISRTMRV